MQNTQPVMELRVLGAAGLTDTAGRELHAVLAQPKRFALLVYLALAADGRLLRRDALVAMFWPEAETERARAALRDSLYFLRRHLGPVVVTRGPDEVGVDPVLLRVDVLEFTRAVAAGDHERALQLYTGPLLSGFNLPSAPDFEDWLDRERSRLRQLAGDTARRMGDVAAERHAWEDAARGFRRALEVDPWQEVLLQRLVHALEQAGDHAGAVAAYEEFATRLAKDLGMGPSEATRSRVQALRTAPSPLPPAAVPPAPAGSVLPGEPVNVAEPVVAPARKPTPMPIPAGSGSRRRRVRRVLPVVALIALVLTVPAFWQAMRGSSGAPAPEPVDLVVLPFTVHGSGSAAYLSDGMVDLFGAKLNGLGGVSTVDPRALLTVLDALGTRTHDLAFGRDVAQRFSAAHFIMGSVVQAGDMLQVSAYLYDREGRQVARADGSLPESALMQLVDDVARRLLAGTFSDAERLAGLAALTTTSLPALRAYLDGERQFRSGDFEAAHASLQQAVALDTTFALAYYRLSSAADWMGLHDVAEPAARAALRFADRLPSGARELVEARNEYWFGNVARAEHLYRMLSERMPTDVEVAYELAEVQFHGGPWRGHSVVESEVALRRTLELQPTHVAAMVHLARVAAMTRRLPLLDSLVDRVAAAEPAHERNLELRALRAALLEDADSLDVITHVIGQARPGVASAAAERVAAFTGDLALAEAIARAALPHARERDRMLLLQTLAHLVAGRGDTEGALQFVEWIAQADPPLAAHVRANLLAAPLVTAAPEDIRIAEAALRALPQEEIPGTPSADPAHYVAERRLYHLGVLALLRGDAATAIDYAEQLERDGTTERDVFARGLAAQLRARVLASAGDHGAALHVLETGWIPASKPLMIGWAWTYSNVNARLLRAQLLYELKRFDEADAWARATVEDIAGTPLVLRAAEHLMQPPVEAALPGRTGM